MYVKVLCLFACGVLISACAPRSATLSDGSTIEMVTVADGPDRSSSLVKTNIAYPPPGVPNIRYDRIDGPTTIGRTVEATVPIATGALIQGAAGIAIADKKGCDDCGNTTISVTGAPAIANAESRSESDASANNQLQSVTCGAGKRCPKGGF